MNEPYIAISQMTLVASILAHIEENAGHPLFIGGGPGLDPEKGKVLCGRHTKAICDAATAIMMALATPPRWATPSMGASQWLDCDDTGQSSLFMLGTLLPGWSMPAQARSTSYQSKPLPRDYADLGRCMRMMESLTDAEGVEAWSNMDKLREASPGWKILADNWIVLTLQYRDNDKKLFWTLNAAGEADRKPKQP